jgi:hypothetical protein
VQRLGVLLAATIVSTPLAEPSRADDAALANAVRAVVPDASPAIVERLLADKVALLPGSDSSPGEPPVVKALVLFSQPKSRVMEFLLQTARQLEYRPELEKVETVEHLPEGDVDQQEMKIMFVRVHYRLRYRYEPAADRLSWALDPRYENGLHIIDGSWELHALDAGHTLARFSTHVDVGPALPAFLQDIATRKNVPQTLERCRKWIDSDGRYRP